MKRILVPLDLTEESGAALPAVADMARGAGATVRLLHVAEDVTAVTDHGHVVVYVDQESASRESAALDHLLGAAAAFEGVPVETVVRFGDPAEKILREAADFEADLIVLGLRRAGLRRFAPGGIATHVCRAADCAVMLLRPGSA